MVPTEAANQKKCVPSSQRCTLLLLLLLLDLGDEGRMQPWGGCATRQETLRAGWWARWAGEDGAGHKTTAEDPKGCSCFGRLDADRFCDAAA